MNVHDDVMDAHLWIMQYFEKIVLEALGTPPNTIDSTATVIDENVKALPAPEVTQ